MRPGAAAASSSLRPGFLRKVSLKHQGFIVCQCSIPVLSRELGRSEPAEVLERGGGESHRPARWTPPLALPPRDSCLFGRIRGAIPAAARHRARARTSTSSSEAFFASLIAKSGRPWPRMALARALRASQASAGGAATRDRGLRATAVTADPTTRSYVQKPALPGRWLAPQGYRMKTSSRSS